MAFRYSLILLLGIMVSCAQVKPLTGGPKDEFAPVPLGIVPKNGTTNFKGQAMALTFDEYIKLNNPLQTVSIIPNDVKITTELQDKTVLFYWDEPLSDNTTYSIFLNRTIKDITESNDSIMQLVFSTGPYIDSLSYTTYIIDAKDATPRKNVVVGLFEHPDSLRPKYFAQTDANGKATFSYLKEGDFYLRAFEDQTKQGIIGKADAIAFREETVQPGVDFIDSMPMRMFALEPKPDLTTMKFQAPAAFYVGATASLENAEIKVNGEILPPERMKFFEKDSFMFILRPGEINPIILSATTEDWTDTIRTRVPNVRSKFQTLKMEVTDYFPNKPIILLLDDQMEALDTSLVTIMNMEDSTFIKDYTYSFESVNELHFHIPDFEGERIKLFIKSTAITASPEWKINDFEKIITKRFDKEFGILNVKVEGYSSPIILEMLLKNKVIKKEFLQEAATLRFEQLEPGEYTFRIIIDENNNQKWDTGSFVDRIQPEEIQSFSKPTKVRANWEIEVELIPTDSVED